MTTIWAPATSPGRAGTAILRVSGPRAAAAIREITRRPPPAARRAVLRHFYDPLTGELIDQGLVLFFKAPASFTGEDTAEFHHHGGPAVANGMAAAMQKLADIRPAEPGEFTRRAFTNGKIDLSQAEALADLIDATTSAQRRQALRQLGGDPSRQIEAWRAALVASMAQLEAEIDFAPDQADVLAGAIEAVRPALAGLLTEFEEAAADVIRAERLRRGLTIAIVGPPNAGKSSLLNRLAGRDAAIVTAFPGTTRDLLEVPLEIAGVPVTLVDTAGQRETTDPVESEGVARAKRAMAGADLVIAVSAVDLAPQVDLSAAIGSRADLLIINKADLLSEPWSSPLVGQFCLVSCLTGSGMDSFLARLTSEVRRLALPEADASFTHARHQRALMEAARWIRKCLEAPPEAELALLAEDLRLAARALGRITGRVGVEELLDQIFARFCIGK